MTTLKRFAPPVLIAAVAVWLYWPSLGFGFMYDDPLDLPRATDRPIIEILTSAGATMYFRPLPLLLWRLAYIAFGQNEAVVLHALLLGLHATCGVLVFVLGRRLYGSYAAGAIAGLMFVTFPFSYQAVMHTAATYHPLVAACATASLILYLKWRDVGGRIWLATSLLAATLAMLSHEYGVVVVVLVAGAEALVLFGPARDDRPATSIGWPLHPSPAVLAFGVLGVAYLAVWLGTPKWNQEISPLASVRPNLLYLIQAISYPFASLIPRFVPAGASVGPVLAIATSVAVLALAAMARWSGRFASFAFALFWAVVAFAPAMVLLPYSYVIDGPRLLYLSSVGISLAWAGGLTSSLTWNRRFVAMTFGAAGIAVALFAGASGISFVQARAPLFDAGAGIVRQIVSTARDPIHAGRIYINAPSWLALRSSDYPYGHGGAAVIPNYIGFGRVLYINTGEQPLIESLTVESIKRDWVYFYDPHGPVANVDAVARAYRRGGSVYVARYGDERIDLELAGEVRSPLAAEPWLAEFASAYRLAESSAVSLGHDIDITLTWQRIAPTSRDDTIFVHVYDSTGRLVTQSDGYAIGNTLPLSAWQPGEEIMDVRHLGLPPAEAAGDYRVAAGIYDRATGNRLTATNAVGSRLRDDAVAIGTVSVP